MDASDNYRVFVCNKCGMIASVNPDKNIYRCKKCNNYIDFSEIRIPYACKLLIQELESILSDMDLVSNFYVLKFNSQNTLFRIIYNGSPKTLLNYFDKKNIDLLIENNIWIIK